MGNNLLGIILVAIALIAFFNSANPDIFLPSFWKELTEWLKIVIEAVRKRNEDAILIGTRVFLKKVGRSFKRLAEHFMKFKNSKQWKKTTTINEELLKESDLPEELLERFQVEATDTIDISEECSEYMDLTYRGGE